MAAQTKKGSTLVVTTTTRIPMDDATAANFIAAVIRETGETYFDGWSLYEFDGRDDEYTATVE